MASPSRYDFPSRPKANPKTVVTGKGSKYRFTVLTDRLLRYEWSEDGEFEDRASVFAPFRWFHAPKFRVKEKDISLEIITDYFHLVYDKKDFTPDGLTVTVGKDMWRYDGKSFGDLGGTARTLDGVDGRTEMEPGVLSRKPYAVLDDSKSMLFDEHGWVASRVTGRKDGYVFCFNGDHRAAIKAFYGISGRQPVLPRWALGNWWSRYHAYSAEEYLELMDHFEKEGIAMSVGILDMDWHRVEDVPPKYGSGWTGYSWNRTLFPDPDSFLKELHRRGLKTALNDHPADGIRAFEDQYEAVAKSLDFDTTHGDPIKFDCTDKKYLDAYLDVLKANLEAQGIDFWWIDWQQGTHTKIPGIDPLWILNHYHYLTARRNSAALGEPLTFSRFAGPGSHRYPIGFSGDTLISWASLHFQPEFTATASNVGYGWWSHDIGGHYWGTRSNELTARWVQLGCFSPILRLHSEKSRWNSKEPWKYERDAHEVMRAFMVFRHRLVPFLYTMSVRASLEGEPLVQPMYWRHSSTKEAYGVPNQYYYGPDLIVAPITTPHSPATLLGGVKAWLPAGRYVDIFRPQLVYDGGREVRFHRTLTDIPVLAKEGTILPLDASPFKGNGTSVPTHFEVWVVVGADGSFELVEEDEEAQKKTEEAKDDGDYVRTPIRWDQNSGKVTIGPSSKPSSRKRHWAVKLLGYSNADAVAATVPSTMKVTREAHATVVELGDVSSATELAVQLSGPNPQLDVVDVTNRLHEVLYRCESRYPLKEVIWQLITADKAPLHVRMAKLYELDMDSAMRDAIAEVWFADERALGVERAEKIATGLAVETEAGSGGSKRSSYVVL